jgi:ribose transport system permease protein
MMRRSSGTIGLYVAKHWDFVVLPSIFALLFVTFFIMTPAFRLPFNLISNMSFASLVAIGSVGMVFVLASGEFDISIGSMLAFVATVGSSLLPEFGSFVAITVTILLAGALGAVNGLFITKLRIPAFITTLGMLFIFRALAFIYTNNTPVYIDDEAWLFAGNGRIFGVPMPIWIMAFSFLVGWVLLRRTPFGRHVLAVGSNDQAAALSGIDVARTKTLASTILGLFVGVAAVVISATLGNANPGYLGQGYEFQVIPAVILGGTILNGGRASLLGAFFAALIVTFLRNGLGLQQVDSYWQFVATGLVLILAVAINRVRFALLGQTE